MIGQRAGGRGTLNSPLNVDVEGVRGHTQWYAGSGVQPGSAASAWCAVACSASPVRSPHLCGGVRKPFSGGSCKLTTRRALPASLQAPAGAPASAIGMEVLALPMNLSRARLSCMFAVPRRGLQQCLQTVPKDATAAESSKGTSHCCHPAFSRTLRGCTCWAEDSTGSCAKDGMRRHLAWKTLPAEAADTCT